MHARMVQREGEGPSLNSCLHGKDYLATLPSPCLSCGVITPGA
jgi:hypothetical protein